MKAVLKLLNSYYFKGFFGPFFIIIFPLLLLFIMGNAMNAQAIASHNKIGFMQGIVAGITITSLISNGLFGLPIMIIEFKKSTLMKRIGAAHISKKQFFGAVIMYQLIWSFFSVIWVLLWAGIIIGTKSGYDWSVSFTPNLGATIPFIILTMISSMSIGLLIVSLVNTQQAVMGITNIIYLPISFLSGSFIPKDNIDSSIALSSISYVLPTKYSVDPFFWAFRGGFSEVASHGWESYGFPIIGILIAIIFIAITIKKFKWAN